MTRKGARLNNSVNCQHSTIAGRFGENIQVALIIFHRSIETVPSYI